MIMMTGTAKITHTVTKRFLNFFIITEIHLHYQNKTDVEFNGESFESYREEIPLLELKKLIMIVLR